MTEEIETPEGEEDPFEAAFKELSTEGGDETPPEEGEGEIAPPEGEEEEEAEELPPSAPVSPPAPDAEQKRRSLLGRIEAQRKGVEKMMAAYKEAGYGTLPWEKSPEAQKLDAAEREAFERVEKSLPEVVQTARRMAREAVEPLAAQVEELVDQRVGQVMDNLHIQQLSSGFPGWEVYADPESEDRADLLEWINAHDLATGKECERIIGPEGTAYEVVELLKAYTTDVEEGVWGAGSEEESEEAGEPGSRAVEAALAVPARGGGSPRVAAIDTISQDDFEKAFAVATREANADYATNVLQRRIGK